MDTEEMYQRGIADAERGELHPFYYQHYYHYRRGYDRARRRLRHPSIAWGGQSRWRRLGFVVAALALIGLGAFAVLRERSQLGSTAALTASSAPTRAANTAAPQRTPLFPTITPSPSPEPIALRVGGAAQIVNTGNQPLRGRAKPSLQAPAKVGFREGERVNILEGPVEADGYTWWRIESPSGAGWSAERSKEGVSWLEPTR
jgi:hypothetical protein